MKIYFSEKYYKNITHLDRTGKREYMIDSIAKPLWVSEKLRDFLNIELVEPQEISRDDLLFVHSEEYVKAVETSFPKDLASSSGLRWVPELYKATISSVSGLYRSIETSKREGLSGTLSTNFHHAKRESGSGFCVFNGISVSVRKAIRELGLNKILIIDCDFHYGDGSAQTLKNIEGVFVYDVYGGFHSANNQIIDAPNLKAVKVKSKDEYQKAIDDLIKFANDYTPDLVLFDTGMDFFEGDRIGGISGVDKEFMHKRDELIFGNFFKCKIPVAFMLGGGYVPYRDTNGEMLPESVINKKRDELIELYLNTIKVASQTVDSVGRPTA